MQDISLSNPTISQSRQIQKKRSLSLEFFEETFKAEDRFSQKPNRSITAKTQTTFTSNHSFLYDSPIKLILVGDSNVGKSCIIKRFIQNEFDANIASTVGISYSTKKISLKANSNNLLESYLEQSTSSNSLNLQIWDTAGSERFRSLTHHFFRGTKGAILVFDLTNRASFLNLNYWMEQIKNNMDENVVKCLFCNKYDENMRQVSNLDIMEFCEKWGINYFEGSAKTGINIEKIFHYVAEEIYENISNSLNKIISLNNLESDVDLIPKNVKKYNAFTAGGKEVALMKLDSMNVKQNKNTCGC